ncbi:MAG: phospholipase D family protein [Acetobacteraceae bacterium]
MRRRCGCLWTAPIGALLALLLLATPLRAAQLTVCFAPPLPGGCDARASVISAIAAARRTVRLQIYAFTSRPILAALVAARRRGVAVRVIVDREQFRNDRDDAKAVRRLAAAGIPVFIDTVPGLMHDKIMIVDDTNVLTGSFNYTWSAEHRNAENLISIHDPGVIGEYLRNWRVRLAASRPLAGPADLASADRAPAGPVQPPAPRAEADGLPGAVRGNRNSRIYQWPGCPYYDRIAASNRVAFPSAQAARAAGYRAAGNCR